MQADHIPRRDPGLVEAVRRLARESCAAPASTFLDYRGNPAGTAHTYSYAELDGRARRIAAGLRELTSEGARVAIVCPHDVEYVTAFLGCLYARRIAVPLPEPDPFRNGSRVSAVLADCEAEAVLTAREPGASSAGLLDPRGWPTRMVLRVQELEQHADDGEPDEDPDPSALAYLQYTSGSTRTPSGVKITHGNLAANVRQVLAVTPYVTSGSVVAGWVPFFHDMGLVLGLALPLIAGAHNVQLSPTAFVQSPYRWLKAVSDYRAVWTGGPNFAYDLCVARIDERRQATLDLSCVAGMFNGSELVRPTSLESFTATFGRCGLSADVDGPAYGLAEATLAVTGPWPGAKPEMVRTFDRHQLSAGVAEPCPPRGEHSRRMVGCGLPLADIDLRIVDPDAACEQAPGRIGEIWLQGPNVAQGYWNQPDRTAQTFGATCHDRHGVPLDGHWLRTGDLGFLYDDMLFITGRRKDLIVIDGRNHDPADLEATVQEGSTEDPVGGVTVFSVDIDGKEQLIVVVEGRRGQSLDEQLHKRMTSSIRTMVARHHGVEVTEVVLVANGAIPRTSSRKVQRGRCREQYLKGRLRLVTAGTSTSSDSTVPSA